ncbi:MAG: hypothetical protein M0C28_21630 [Candidatus Moduliflexus flocculans]|nr:hypothetical protein [Candidatus Moduliflexus flocculans]
MKSALTQHQPAQSAATAAGVPGLHGRLLYGSDMPLVKTIIATPFAFPLRLSCQMLEISRIHNRQDRDIALKEALGLRKEMLAV